jgi:predicted deacylase
MNRFDYPIEIARPDISRWKAGNRGIDYVWTYGSHRPGPHVWINSITHGKEICGALALDHLLHRDLRPERGTLTLSFANISAFAAADAGNPLGRRFVDQDMNRVWDKLDSDARSIELDRARALAPLAEEADYLFDLHAMSHPTEPLVIVGRTGQPEKVAQGVELVRRIGAPTLMVTDRGHDAGLRLRDYRGFGDPASGQVALVVECGGWWAVESVTFAFEFIRRVLDCFEMADTSRLGLPRIRERARPFRLLRSTETVTIRTSEFRFVLPFQGDEIIPRAGTPIAVDGDREIRTPFDDCFLMFPVNNPEPGVTAVRFGRASEVA